jgi:hypothetical protein
MIARLKKSSTPLWVVKFKEKRKARIAFTPSPKEESERIVGLDNEIEKGYLDHKRGRMRLPDRNVRPIGLDRKSGSIDCFGRFAPSQ